MIEKIKKHWAEIMIALLLIISISQSVLLITFTARINKLEERFWTLQSQVNWMDIQDAVHDARLDSQQEFLEQNLDHISKNKEHLLWGIEMDNHHQERLAQLGKAICQYHPETYPLCSH